MNHVDVNVRVSFFKDLIWNINEHFESDLGYKVKFTIRNVTFKVWN